MLPRQKSPTSPTALQGLLQGRSRLNMSGNPNPSESGDTCTGGFCHTIATAHGMFGGAHALAGVLLLQVGPNTRAPSLAL